MSEQYKKLGSVAEIQSGFAFPSHSYEDSGIPIVRMSDLKNGYLRFENTKYVSDFWLTAASSFKLDESDFLLGMSGSLENHAIVKCDNLPALLNQRVARLKSRNSLASYKYLCFWLSSDFYHRYADIQGEGAAQKNIRSKQIESFRVRLPVVEEQRKIAEILETIDSAIEKTESLITKYQQIKAGLMHDLFTRGVTANGKLRPPREQAPELYKETPIGWIPKEWECKTVEQLLAPLGNNLRSGPFGSALLKSELVEDGIPFLGIDNIYAEHFEAKFRRRVTRKKFIELNRYSVRPRDVVITIMGTVGRCSVLPDDVGEALSSKHLWTMTFDQSLVIPELICWQLNFSPWVLSWFKRESQGAVMDSIQSSTLRSLKLPVPPIHEQQEIFKKYSVFSLVVKSEQNTLDKLEKEKHGLMRDLLTGRVRVSIKSVKEKTV